MSSDLLGIPPTYLPTDPATALLAETPADRVAAAHPTSSLAWAALAERSLEREEEEERVRCTEFLRASSTEAARALGL